ncbi:hypothetical protein MY4038_009642 [Beauveria bassiana]
MLVSPLKLASVSDSNTLGVYRQDPGPMRQRVVVCIEMVVRALAIIMLALALGIFIYLYAMPGYIMCHSSRSFQKTCIAVRIALEAAATGGAIGGGFVVLAEPAELPDCDSPTCQAASQIGIAREPAATLIWITAALHYVLLNLVAVEYYLLLRKYVR